MIKDHFRNLMEKLENKQHKSALIKIILTLLNLKNEEKEALLIRHKNSLDKSSEEYIFLVEKLITETNRSLISLCLYSIT